MSFDPLQLSKEEAEAGIGEPPVVPKTWPEVIAFLCPGIPIRPVKNVQGLLFELKHTVTEIDKEIESLEFTIERSKNKIESRRLNKLMIARLVSTYDLPNRILEKEKKCWWLNEDGNELRIKL